MAAEPGPEFRRDLKIRNRLGLHARAAVKFVQLASHFKCDIMVLKDGAEVYGKSIMGLLTLVAAHGTDIAVVARGVDAEAAANALAELVSQGFGEGVEDD